MTKHIIVSVCHLLDLDPDSIAVFTAPYISRKGNRYSLEYKPANSQIIGLYLPRHSKHVIITSEALCNSDAMLESTLAHEIIHAWQYEKLKGRMQHGKRDYFTQWSEYILQELGIDTELQVESN